MDGEGVRNSRMGVISEWVEESDPPQDLVISVLEPRL